MTVPAPATSRLSRIRSVVPSIREADAVALVALLSAPLLEEELPARVDRIEELFDWLRGRPVPVPPEARDLAGPAGSRLWVLVETLRGDDEARLFVAGLFRSVFSESSAVTLFAETGLPRSTRFFAEAFRRLAANVIPTLPNDRELSDVVESLIRTGREARGFARVPEALFEDFLEVLFPPAEPSPWKRLRTDVGDAIVVLAGRASAIGLHSDLRARTGEVHVSTSPFFSLSRSSGDAVRLALDPATDLDEVAAAARAVGKDLAACRLVLERGHGSLERHGVSVDLVFQLDLLAKTFARMERLLGILTAASKATARRASHDLLVELSRLAVEERSVRALVHENGRLLSRKVAERVGASGETYVTNTRAEWLRLLRSAAGGGLVTAGTIVVKYWILVLPIALFWEGLLASLNYAGSFLLMQVFHFSLATKQSSAFAAALAGALKEHAGRKDFGPLVEVIARTCRSQIAAAAGNVVVVTAAVVALESLFHLASGSNFLAPDKAAATLASFHPFRSGTLFYAAITGVLLWLSSLVAGAAENWAAWKRLPEAIASNRGLVRRLGRERAARLGPLLERNVAGWAGNVSIGFFLGMTPALAHFFGLPIDIRHVTLGSGQIAFAAMASGTKLLSAPFLWAFAGIVGVGVLNLGVSIALALGIALRARGVAPEDRAGVLAAVWDEFRREPRGFFLPPPRGEEEKAAAPSVPHG